MYIFTDGAARSNGQISCVASYGVYAPDLYPSRYNGRVLREPSNQRGELMGICRALEICIEQGVSDAVIVTDSLYAIKCFTTWWPVWKRNGWKTAKGQDVKHLDLIQQGLAVIVNHPNITLQHIRSHQPRPVGTGSALDLWEGNRMADSLATAALSDRT